MSDVMSNSMPNPMSKPTSKQGDIEAIKSVQDGFVEDFSFFDEWEDKYSYLIDLGKKLEDLPESYKVDAHRLKGCQAHVWFMGEVQDGKLQIRACSEAAIVSGLIGMLLQIYSNRDPQAILEVPPYFIEEIGLSNHLSPTRSNGLASMVKEINRLAALAVA